MQPTHLDFTGACKYVCTVDIHTAKNSSEHLAQILSPLNACLQSLKLPKGPKFPHFLSSFKERVKGVLFPNLHTIAGSFLQVDLELLSTLPRLASLELHTICAVQKNCVTSFLHKRVVASVFNPLLECRHLNDLNLPWVDGEIVSLMGQIR